MVERNRLEVHEIDLKVIHNLWITLWRIWYKSENPFVHDKEIWLISELVTS